MNGASHELARLAKALAQPGPVGARGVAQAVLLLRDGTGPLYNGGGQPCLREYLTIATQNLELVPGGTIERGAGYVASLLKLLPSSNQCPASASSAR